MVTMHTKMYAGFHIAINLYTKATEDEHLLKLNDKEMIYKQVKFLHSDRYACGGVFDADNYTLSQARGWQKILSGNFLSAPSHENDIYDSPS